jgi:hypothetical protein
MINRKKIKVVTKAKTLFNRDSSEQEFTILDITPEGRVLELEKKYVKVSSSVLDKRSGFYSNSNQKYDCADYNFYFGKARFNDYGNDYYDIYNEDSITEEEDLFCYAILKNNLEGFTDLINDLISNLQEAHENSSDSNSIPNFRTYSKQRLMKETINDINVRKIREILDLVDLCLEAKQRITEKNLKFMYNSIKRTSSQNLLQIDELKLINYFLF